MFLVFNKEKIYSYIIAVFTVILLFTVSEIYIQDDKFVETGANITNQNVDKNNSQNMSNKLENATQLNKK